MPTNTNRKSYQLVQFRRKFYQADIKYQGWYIVYQDLDPPIIIETSVREVKNFGSAKRKKLAESIIGKKFELQTHKLSHLKLDTIIYC